MITLLIKPHSFPFNYRHQSGAVLAISLIILLLLTLIGLTAAQVTGLEEKMAGNLRDRNLAFQAAESALRAGEEKTSELHCENFVTRVGGFYPFTNAARAAENSAILGQHGDGSGCSGDGERAGQAVGHRDVL